MKVLLVSEGPHELQNLVRRLLNANHTFELRDVRDDRRMRIRGAHGKGFRKLAILWIYTAAIEKFDSLVLVLDEDGDTSRRDAIQEAQEFEPSRLPRALGIAIRTFDAWMLADEMALSTVFGGTVDRQSNPEIMKDPKGRFDALSRARGHAASNRELYAGIAESMDLSLLEERCPKGFQPFADRVRELASRA